MMTGLTEPTSGSVHVCGVNSTSKPVEVKRRVGYLPEDVGFYPEFSGLENLVYTARLNGIPTGPARNKANEMLDRVGLTDQGKKRTGTYSRGMRQRLGLADVLIKTPQVIILDEPTLGLDPEGVRELLELIRRLSKEEGLTVLLSSHQLHQVQQVCDRVGVFVGGKLIAQGVIPQLSRELFAGEAFIVEARVATRTFKKVKEHLEQLDGVNTVTREQELFRISCTRDITAEISKEIISAGAGITWLKRQEYGLDDIYNRYFEGGTENV